MLDVTVDKFDGGMYQIAEPVTVYGKSAQDGYLYLIGISPKGDITMLYPQAGDQNLVRAGEEFSVPGPNAKYQITTAGLIGQYRVKAIVTDKPLVLGGWDPEMSAAAPSPNGKFALDRSNFRWTPTMAEQTGELVKKVLEKRTNGPGETVKRRFSLTHFAQDEVSFIVRKPKSHKN